MQPKARPHGRDVLPAMIVAAVQLVFGNLANLHQSGTRDLDALGFALLLAGPLLLVVRRTHPRTVFLGVLAVTAAYLLIGYGYGPIFLSLVFAFLTAAARCSRWYTYPFLPVGYLLMVWPVPALRGYSTNGWQAAGLLAWLAVLVAVAEGIRQRRSVLVARRERAEAARANERAERARELARREQRATEERLAIARELHDVLAHSLSVINVQSSVALELLDRKPEQAATSLAAIKEASRDALGEVHALLRSIRAGAGTVAVPTSPAVGIGDLDTLLGPPRAAGLTVRTDIRGTAQRLPAVLDGAAARIVQESLTNVLRHAPSSEAVVTVDYSPGTVRLTIDSSPPRECPQSSTIGGYERTAAAGDKDASGTGYENATAGTDYADTPPASPEAGGSTTSGPVAANNGGNGIPGMIERAHALGGELTAEPRPGGGFRVRARLPVPQHDTDSGTDR
ncbi:sensor histidine kinase [Nocardia sp. BMG51109]|uniref:sensor histidine kinase n=1 Tax=Nocardia sp. BMG51109 TaxID=1056816 RepID=UPI0004AD9F16|nr:histidine kinase [Nocardia sp. BMG51109]